MTVVTSVVSKLAISQGRHLTSRNPRLTRLLIKKAAPFKGTNYHGNIILYVKILWKLESGFVSGLKLLVS